VQYEPEVFEKALMHPGVGEQVELI